VNIAIEVPGKRGADHYAGEDAKSNCTDQTPSRHAPAIRTLVDYINSFARVIPPNLRCCGVQFFVVM
jgi:hypothetical protein